MVEMLAAFEKRLQIWRIGDGKRFAGKRSLHRLERRCCCHVEILVLEKKNTKGKILSRTVE